MGVARDLFVPYKISSNDKTKFTKMIIWKNYGLICASMMFFYTAVNAIGGVQSTVNKEGGLGLVSSCVVYAVFGVSALMLPQLLMGLITFKWTFTLGLSLQLFYISLNAYPKYYTYLPASALGGIGQALAFTCSGTGVRKLCQIYSEVTGTDATAAQGLFFGVFGIALQLAGVLGYLFIAVIFDDGKGNKVVNNSTLNFTNGTFDYSVCGANFCPESKLPPAAETDLMKVYALVGTLGACTVISIILSLFMNDVDYIPKEDGVKVKQIIKYQAGQLKLQFFQLNQLLAAPMNLMNAFVLTFLWVDFTRSFAACSAGLNYIGWATMVLYAAAAFFSPIFGKIAEKFTIVPVFLFYWALTIATCIWMLLWRSDPSTLYNLFILAALLGTIESINTPIPRALYGMIFQTEVIYSSFTFFQGMGMLFGFLITTYTCAYVKISIMIAYAVISFFCGIALYLKLKREKSFEVTVAPAKEPQSAMKKTSVAQSEPKEKLDESQPTDPKID